MRWLGRIFLFFVSLGFLGLVAVAGGVAWAVHHFGQDLPDYNTLKNYDPPMVTRLYAGDGRLMAEYAEEKRVFVPINAIPDLVKESFISAEDQHFYQHHGIDFIAIARAVVKNLKNPTKRPEGASTITQQVAKNFLLNNEVSYKRKIREAIISWRMEQSLTKDQILELYLNEIYLGQGSYGVAAAARNYFGKPLAELKIHEAAYLAALPKAPNNYNPVRNHDAAVERRNFVIGRLKDDGHITDSQADLATTMPLETVSRSDNGIINAPYFAEEVRRELSMNLGQDSLYKGGMTVRTSVDPNLQDIATKSLRDGLMAFDRRHGWRGAYKHFKTMVDWTAQLSALPHPEGMPPEWMLAVVVKSTAVEATLGFVGSEQGKMPLDQMSWARKQLKEGYKGPEITAVDDVLERGDVVMVEPVTVEGQKNIYALRQIPEVGGGLVALDPHTGRVLAMQGGWSYEQSEFNRATQAKRQPGSAFKPFVYLPALEKGFTPATLVSDSPIAISPGPGLPLWRPENYTDDYYGPTPLRIGLEKSRNLMTVRIAQFVSMPTVVETAKKFGVIEDMKPMIANSLGSGETTLLRITAAYGEFVNGGKKINPTFIDRIQDKRGKTVFRHDDRDCKGCGAKIRWEHQATPDVPDTREQLTDPRIAYLMTNILSGVVERGTATKLKDLNRPLAGKTGTTNDSRDTWFIGFSPDLVVGVFVGYDEPRNMGKKETGASVAVPIFKDFMAAALKDAPPMPFRIPPGVRQVQINRHTGARASYEDSDVIWESFIADTEPEGAQSYILDNDSTGIMPAAGEGGGYESGEPLTTSTESATTGTGGLY